MNEIKPVAYMFDWVIIKDDVSVTRPNQLALGGVIKPTNVRPLVLQSEYEKLKVELDAMKITQKILDGTIRAQSMTDCEWRERYMREVEGLNNEGDAIGGEPPTGLRHSVEHLKARCDELERQLKLTLDMGK